LGIIAIGFCVFELPAALAAAGEHRALCDDNAPLCTERSDLNGGVKNYEGRYVGHDEPSVLFYSNVPGSGNSSVYRLRLPKDPPRLPTQDGSGGTFNFQLRPAFWFGMAMCDSQSFPNPGQPCTPDSDANIFDGANPAAPDYIGKHPGTAFMEMQFYPPGWVLWPAGNSCDPLKWCAALNIDSLSENPNTGQDLNVACQERVGIEYVNFAFITKTGVAHAPANPVDATLATYTANPATDLFMNSGDWLIVALHDTPQGFEVVIQDLTTGESGSMKASAANGFGQVRFAPPPSTACDNIPYDFHPMYSTSSEHTRVPWAAHSYNVAFSDEIGHFEYCSAVDANGNCIQTNNGNDPGSPDDDDAFCHSASESSRIQIGGCFGTDVDFDGVSYQLTWPGSLSNPGKNNVLNPDSVLFSSPTFVPTAHPGTLANYSRVAFETDLPRIEFATNPPCNRITGANCVNPPVGANFYPIFTTRMSDEGGGCVWQLGGANIPGTKNTFGGTSTAEYGPLLQLVYPGFGTPTTPRFLYNNFRNILTGNACPSGDAN
jgi:hypothetical protein